MTNICNKQNSLGATQVFGKVAFRLTGNIVVIRSDEKFKYVKLINGGKFTSK